MSIRPLDMQVVLHRADQNFHARQTIVNKNLNEQANFAQIHDREIKQKLSVVSRLKDSAEIDYLKREKKHNHSKESQQEFGAHHRKKDHEFQNEIFESDDENYNAYGKKTHFGSRVFDLKI